MPVTVTKPVIPTFDELDRVQLKSQLSVKGVSLAAGKIGTIVYCHGTEAYEVEFSGIHDVFQIEANDLQKA